MAAMMHSKMWVLGQSQLMAQECCAHGRALHGAGGLPPLPNMLQDQGDVLPEGGQSQADLHQLWHPPASGASNATPGALGHARSSYIGVRVSTTSGGFGSGAAHGMAKYSQSLSPELIRAETSALQALTFTASFFTQAPSLSRKLLKQWKNPMILQQTISMAVMSLFHVGSALPMKAAAAPASEAVQGWIYFFIFNFFLLQG